jgi:acetylornithine deacetylase/succinyl-diaminopimelate desuccinylase-like protein
MWPPRIDRKLNSVNFQLALNLRDDAHHSGNWGGLLRNPATVLANALASLVDARGVIVVAGLRPPPIPEAVRRALADITVGGGPGDPAVDDNWGEPGLTPAERVFGWNSFEVLAFKAGNPENPVNAIPSSAFAHCQLRFVVGTDWHNLAQRLRTHLDAHGFPMVEVTVERGAPATRLDPDDPWVKWAIASLEQTTGKKTAVLPNLGARCRTRSSPTRWVCRPSGCRIRIQPARSARRTNICSDPSHVKNCRSWPASSGTSARTHPRRLQPTLDAKPPRSRRSTLARHETQPP